MTGFFTLFCNRSSSAPPREDGSLTAIVEADDDGVYVVKFRGAGQGLNALIAELMRRKIGRWIGLPAPEIVFVELDSVLVRSEPGPEIRDLIKAPDARPASSVV